MLTGRLRETVGKSVSGVTFRTEADSHMIDHEALRPDATRARAWISAFLPQTRAVATAL